MLFRVRWSSDFAPAIALIFLFLQQRTGFVVMLWWMISSIHLVLMVVMVEVAMIALHQVAWNILRWCMTQRWVSQVHQEGALVNNFCTWNRTEKKNCHMNHQSKYQSVQSIGAQQQAACATQKTHGREVERTRFTRRSKNKFVIFFLLLARWLHLPLANMWPNFYHPDHDYLSK